MTKDEIREILKRDGMQSAILIGSRNEREDYYPAIVSCDEEKGVVTYDYGLLAECFAEKFFRQDGKDSNYEKSITDAFEWIDYNVICSLPYLGEHAPVVREKDEDDD